MSKTPTFHEFQKLENKVSMLEGLLTKNLEMLASLEPNLAMAEVVRQQAALVATINADRAEKFSDRVTQWKIEAMLNFVLQKSGSKLPLPEGSPEGTPQQVVSWYQQFMPKWQKFMADFQIQTNAEGKLPDEKLSDQEANAADNADAGIPPESLPENTVSFPSPRPEGSEPQPSPPSGEAV